MFTGIIQDVGTVMEVQDRAQDRELVVGYQRLEPGLRIGDSVCVDGVCQTVTEVGEGRFRVHAIAETLRVTTLGQLRRSARVNLEPALGAGQPLGGHFVQGHVDGVAVLESKQRWGDSWRYTFGAPEELVAQLVPKGSVTIDGISLTVGPELTRNRFEVFLIPHTLEVTTLGEKEPSDHVNLETDILGKYLQRYLGPARAGKTLDWSDLHRTGFLDPDAGGSHG